MEGRGRGLRMFDRWLDAYEKSTEKYKWLGMSWQMWVSIALSSTALLLAILCPASPYKWFIFLGMLLSTLGDFLLSPHPLAKKVYQKADCQLLVGGGAFAVAHCFYAYGFMQKAKAGGGLPLATWICFGILFFVAVVGLGICNLKNKNPRWGFTRATMIYGGLICLDCAMVFGSAVQVGTTFSWIAVLGAASFYASDAILLAGAVGPTKIRHYEAWIWITYPVAQILLVWFA